MHRLLIVLALTACTSGPRNSDERPAEHRRKAADVDKPLLQAVAEIHARMHQRFSATERMRTAIAMSDLERAQREAQLVAGLDEPDLLPAWRPYVDEIQAASRDIARAGEPAVAATRMAALGLACARCHEAAEATLEVPLAARPEAQPGLSETMATHHWAAGLMWQGLIMPSLDRWTEGARALATAPLAITAEADAPPHGLGIANDVARIRLLAQRASTPGSLDDRAELYGELLGTCVRCHQVIRDR